MEIIIKKKRLVVEKKNYHELHRNKINLNELIEKKLATGKDIIVIINITITHREQYVVPKIKRRVEMDHELQLMLKHVLKKFRLHNDNLELD